MLIYYNAAAATKLPASMDEKSLKVILHKTKPAIYRFKIYAIIYVNSIINPKKTL